MALDSDWIRFTLSGLGAGIVAAAGGAAFVFGAIGKVRKEAEDGDRAIWKAMSNADRDDAEHRIDNERRYATKDDLVVLESRILKRLDEHEARANAAVNSGLQQIQMMISNRLPVGGK